MASDVLAEDIAGGIPDPLTLEQALAFADGHPRVELASKPALAQRAPSRVQPLYLGCHSLAFTGTRPADAERDVAWSQLLAPVAAQRLEIMQRFFDVLLAELSFARDNEAMAVAFLRFDRARAREELGQFSPLETAQLEADYQRIRRQRAASEAAQRVTRTLLAGAIGRSEYVPRRLVDPTILSPDAALPNLDRFVAQALDNNPHLVELAERSSPAERRLLTNALRERAMELLTRLELLDVIAEQTRSESDWRDLKLDESRTMYELEARADLGFSMSQQTKAWRDERETQLCRMLTRTELDALRGAGQ